MLSGGNSEEAILPSVQQDHNTEYAGGIMQVQSWGAVLHTLWPGDFNI